MIEQKLGIINGTFLGHSGQGIFGFALHIDYGSSGQGFGPYCLSHRPDGGTEIYNPLIGEAIGKICAAVGVSCWENLKGQTVYVGRDTDTNALVSIEAPPFVQHGPAYNIIDHLGQDGEGAIVHD